MIGLHHNTAALAVGTASHYLSPEQAGSLADWQAGWRCINKATLFFYLAHAAMSPLHGQSFIIYRPALEV